MAKRLLTLLWIVATFLLGNVASYAAVPDTTNAVKSKNWVKQLFDNGFRLNDPSVNYPRFPRFCLKVYNWGDKTFNSYDTAYVVSTGKNWKAVAKSYNWAETYFIDLGKKNTVIMNSDLYSDLGASINFMAMSLSYMMNANDMFGAPVAKRRTLDFSFTCALFTGNYHASSTHGGVSIRKFAKFNNGHHINYDFNDVKQTRQSGDIYYFFNHNHYSHAAAYCFSKYQLRSAGSWVLGLSFNRTNIDIDFTSLPHDMLQSLPEDAPLSYALHYNDYCLIGGYAQNWVLHPRRWLINLTTLPALGVKHLRNASADRKKDMFAANLKMTFSIVYNHKAIFTALTGNLDAGVYAADNYSFVNSQESFSLSVGARF
ncbi:MAG: DUF4421 domain-containing protein [Muribaculum sp.]|nr:DUF4421 domain-containing protein [Muribaculaceae bacterium]MCM1081484.1 DUF4421 domain-containing protein [Muribaculum sp.]MCM1140379.1 DUF4421 domain-containing protein [Muribaculum sp.]MCM1505338.1 DUF4421 domain-containing protein [Muribaculum sp.]